jgi:hypothetical protein
VIGAQRTRGKFGGVVLAMTCATVGHVFFGAGGRALIHARLKT